MPSCRGVREGSCRRRGLIRRWRRLSCACASDLIPASALPFGKVLYFSMVQLLLIRLSSMRKLLVWDSGEMVLSAQCSAGLPTPTHGRRNVGRGGGF